MIMLIDSRAAVNFLKHSIPNWSWLLGSIESEGGYFRFPVQFSRLIANLKIESYPRLYENEAAIGLIVLKGFLSNDQIYGLNSQLEAATPGQRGELLTQLVHDLDGIDEEFEFPKTPEGQRLAEEAFKALPPDEQEATIRRWQHFLCGFLAGFHQALAVTVHGTKLTSLVAQAKSGDDGAFAKAIQIDKRTLTEIPYFKERWSKAHSEGDAALLRDVGGRLARPPYIGRIRHKELYLALSFFDSVGILSSVKHQELLDLLDEAGIGRHKNRIDDLKNFSKRLAEYRRFQRVGADLSTP